MDVDSAEEEEASRTAPSECRAQKSMRNSPQPQATAYKVSDVSSFRDDGDNLRSRRVLRKGGRRERGGAKKKRHSFALGCF